MFWFSAESDLPLKCICVAVRFVLLTDRFAELQEFSSLELPQVIDSSHCDVIINKPTIFIKLDSGRIPSSSSIGFCLLLSIHRSECANKFSLTMPTE